MNLQQLKDLAKLADSEVTWILLPKDLANEGWCKEVVSYISVVSPSTITALVDRIEAAERERDELRAGHDTLQRAVDNLDAERDVLRAELARRDAAALEPVAVVDIQRGRGDGKKFALCYTSAGHSLPDDVYMLYTDAAPAVLPVVTDLAVELLTAALIDGADARTALKLAAPGMGAQPQKTVVLPAERFCAADYAGSLLWAETEVWNKAIYECAASLDAANVPYELKP